MSSGQAPKRRSPSVIESSKYAPARPPADDRRRQLDSLGQDRAAIERAKQEMAEISRQQGGRARAEMPLDDVEVQRRKSLRFVPAPAPQASPDPALSANASARSAGPDAPLVDTDVADQHDRAIEDRSTRRPSVSEPKNVKAGGSARSSRITFEHVEHRPVVPAAPTRSMPIAQSAAYSCGEHYGSAYDAQPYWEAPMTLARRNPLVLMALVALVCVPVIWMLSQSPKTFISSYSGAGLGSTVGNVVSKVFGGGDVSADVPAGEHSILGQPSITADQIDALLAQYNSPAQGTGKAWIALGRQYGIDPIYAVAFFIHESSAGTNPGWAGIKPDGSTTHNVGNIICAGYATCYGRFRDYASWDEGISDWYKLISNEYVRGRGIASIEQIVPIYAPSSDNNDVPGYINVIVSMVDSWHQGVLR